MQVVFKEIERNANGKFLPGISGNPKGSPPRPWQPYKYRLMYWMGKLMAGELLALASNPRALNKLSTIDAVAVRQMANVLAGDRKEREDMLDRIEGKSRRFIQQNADEFVIDLEELISIKEAERLYREISARTS